MKIKENSSIPLLNTTQHEPKNKLKKVNDIPFSTMQPLPITN